MDRVVSIEFAPARSKGFFQHFDILISDRPDQAPAVFSVEF
jgi:hypothetical protein